jgi:hypothetical protein
MRGQQILRLGSASAPAPDAAPRQGPATHFETRPIGDRAASLTAVVATDTCIGVERLTAQAAMFGHIVLVGVLPAHPRSIEAAVDLEADLLFVGGTHLTPDWVAALGRLAPDRRPMLLFMPDDAMFAAPGPGVAEPDPDTDIGLGAHDTLVVGDGRRVLIFRADEIDWIRAEGKWSTISAGGGTYSARRALGHLERQLDPLRFVRVHRSLIVRLGSVTALEPGFHGDYELVLKDGTRLPMSRRYVKSFFAATALG